MLMNEIVIFKPKSAKKEVTISSPLQANALSKLEERMGKRLGNKAKTAFDTLQAGGFNALQFDFQGRKVKVRQVNA